MTEQMYAVDYRLRNIYRGRIIEAGQPRTDRSLATGARAEASEAFEATGLSARGRKVFVYAPTWKGASFYRPEDSSADIREILDVLQDALGPQWLAVAKVHQSVYAASVKSGNLRGRLVDNDIPTNVVLAGADALMTDYSSIFFDFLCLDRPIFFYLADADHYSSTRGLYESIENLPGSKASTIDELVQMTRRLSTGDPEPVEIIEARRVWRDRYAPKDDGSATQRVVDVVFRKKADSALVDISRDRRERVLIYLGSMKSMGITTSGLNLLANIDHERFDVSAVYTYTVKSDPLRNIRAIDRRVRHLPRLGAMNGSKVTHLRRERLMKKGIPAHTLHRADIPVAHLFRDEWVRCFGDAEFDYIIDFSGYGSFWDCILLQGRGAKHSIWLHNDLYADARRETNGVRHLYDRLHSVFTTYRFFDHLVSVSAALSKVNAANLADYAPTDRFTYAANTIDFERILRMAEPPPPAPVVEPGVTSGDSAATDEVIAEAAALDVEEGEIVEGEEAGDGLTEQVTTWSWRQAAPGVTTFVTVGRLSPEKNQERLIRAFARVHADHPDTRLIILGGGPILGRLRSLIKELGMTGHVQLAGFLSNPFRVLTHCDCFVLPSDHEGQPMVILEALTLGLPVIATQFSSVDGAIPPGCGIVVPRSVEGVEHGLREFLAGRIPAPDFDPAVYNRQAMAEFYAAIGVRSTD
jgi:glycosyltransferase involved in cell wall biosynthesis